MYVWQPPRRTIGTYDRYLLIPAAASKQDAKDMRWTMTDDHDGRGRGLSLWPIFLSIVAVAANATVLWMDSFFSSYETVKYVAIPDRRLAVLRGILLLAILMYVVVVELIQQNGYLEPYGVTGLTRFSLQQPTVQNCNPATPGCSNAFSPLSSLPYCSQYKGDGNYSGPIYPCQIYEAVNAQVIRETSLVLWTRATTYNQTLICHSTADTCPQTYQNTNEAAEPFYIAQSEAFTLLMEHAVTSSSLCRSHSRSTNNQKPHYSCSAQAKDYQGRLKSRNEALCQSEHAKNNSFTTERSWQLTDRAPCFIGPNRTTNQQDFFSVNVLLQAAGVTLDDCVVGTNDSTTDNEAATATRNCSSTLRSSGGTLLLQVVWNDAVSWRGLVEPHYVYLAQLIGDSYKESQSFYYREYREARILMRAHGLKVALVVEGTFHQFEMVQFLIRLTTALGLLAVARVVVDHFMLHVLPDKERYQQAKYETMTRTITTSGDDQASSSSRRSNTMIREREDAAETFAAETDAVSSTTGDDDMTEPLLPTQEA